MRKFVLYCIWITFIAFNYCASQDDSSSEEIICEDPWQKLHRSCVQFIKDKPYSTWQEARQACIDMKADLLCINDLNEKNKLPGLLKQHIRSLDTLHWWVGLRQVGENDAWMWVDNEEFNKNVVPWAPQEGHVLDENGNPVTNQCAYIDYQRYLHDTDCEETYPYICEQIKLTPPPTSTTSTRAPVTTGESTTQNTTQKTTSTPTTNVSVTTTTKSTRTQTTRQPPNTSAAQNKSSKSNETNTTTTAATTTTTTTTTASTTTTTTTTVSTASTNDSTGATTEQVTKGSNSTKKNTRTPKPTKATSRTKKTTPVPMTTVHSTLVTEAVTEAPEDTEKFRGCYAINYESTCPPVEAFGIQWPRTEAGKMAIVPCDGGKNARWKCDKNPTCWREEPDVKQCTSENIQDLTKQLDDLLENADSGEVVESFTEELASTASSDTVMSEQDIYQSTKLLNATALVKPKNASVAKNVIKNVAKCGSSLVSERRMNTWASMKKENQRTVAASLLSSMETVSVEMMKSIDKPTVEKIIEDNIAIELQVVDIKDTSHVQKITFDAGSTNFAIPKESIHTNSSDDLVRLVFINYESVGALLNPADAGKDDGPSVVSQVVSASVGGMKSSEQPLEKPITFTMYTGDLTAKHKQLCSFWNFSLEYVGAWSQKGCSFKSHNFTHTTCQCNHLTNFAILMDIHSTKIEEIHATTLTYVTYVGIIISIICLFLSWITFMCLSIRCMRGTRGSSGMADGQEYYGNSTSSARSSTGSRSAQGERNSIHKNLVFCLFVAEVLFLAGIERTDHRIACAIIAGFLHYFFLASFSWMFVEGIHILFMLVQVFDAAKSRLRYYYGIGYGAPLFIVGISALVYHDGYGTQRYCWLTTDRMFIWSFAGPVAFILLVNLMILIYAMSAVCKHSEYVFAKEKSATGNMKAWIQGALAIEVLLGLTWVFGYFYISEEAIPIAYLFTIFNSLQGLFIFVFHCLLNKKVRKEYQRFIDFPRKPVTSSGINSTSKGAHHNGSGPQTASYNMSSRKPSGPFLDLNTDRRQSTTSA